MWPLVKHNKKIREYLPAEEMDEGEKYPDRKFFWGVAFTVLPDWSEKYYKAVIDKKRREIKENPNNKKTVAVSERFK